MAKNKEIFNDYDVFVEKFKPKKTTDDCYTPPAVYAAVLQYVREAYHIADDVPIVRPFYPGGDYEHYDYPEGCVVVDNPPFSIFAKILDFYQARGIRFFLFAPHLSGLGTVSKRRGITFVSLDYRITYTNGAVVNTAFVTNITPELAVATAPRLLESIRNLSKKKERKKTIYPPPKFSPSNQPDTSRIQTSPFDGARWCRCVNVLEI